MPPRGAAACAHDHDCGAEDCGAAWSLYKHVDIQRVRCLNEAVEGSCRAVFRAWGDRGAPPRPAPLRSGVDAELLLHVPLAGSAKLAAIAVVGPPGAGGGPGPGGADPDAAPARMRAFVNRDDLDFDAVAEGGVPPAQEWDLVTGAAAAAAEYPCHVARFNGVHALTLHFPANFGDERGGGGQTEVWFVGLKGEFSERRRGAVAAVYEARPLPGDHPRVPGEDAAGSRLGM